MQECIPLSSGAKEKTIYHELRMRRIQKRHLNDVGDRYRLMLSEYLQRELGMSDSMLKGSTKAVMNRVWERFRAGLLNFHVKRGDFDSTTVAELLNAANKQLDLDWPARLRLKARFVTKGVALGSQAFVEEALAEFSVRLGYRRKHTAEEALAWDDVYRLKNIGNGSDDGEVLRFRVLAIWKGEAVHYPYCGCWSDS